MKAWQRKLSAWYAENKRDLPWRRTKDPYAIWVSEVMLQQTQVKTVLPYYGKFLKTFPSVAALAKAKEERVLAAWAGLGYYRRARNLHRGAQEALSRFKGKVPDSTLQLESLPGLGRYSAAAVGSIAFGLPAAVVDGNVIRVLSRIFGIQGDPAKGMDRYWDLAQELVPQKKSLKPGGPGDWNQAMMELGATICLPRGPLCSACPVRRECVARKKKLQDKLPEIPSAKDSVDLRLSFLLSKAKGKTLLEKRPSTGLLAEHWGLPELDDEALGRVRSATLIGSARHSITHHRIDARLVGGTWASPLPSSWKWTPDAEAEALLVSSLWRKLLAPTRAAKKPKN